MNQELIYDQLDGTCDRIAALIVRVSPDQAKWRPNPSSWSILEVINHLYDEEREDFRVRLDVILHHPTQNPPPIDPQGWVSERRYNERDLASSFANFQSERSRSLAWLQTLAAANWDAEYQAPFAILRAGDMLAAWLIHDWLHIRQIVELQRRYAMSIIQPYNADYASPQGVAP